MNPSNTSISKLLCLLVLATSVGCTLGKGDGWRFTKSMKVIPGLGSDREEIAPPQVPTRLVSTWQDTVLNRQGEKSQRGFGGRILFFNEESEDPIRVEGQLVVYAYDDSDRAAHETHPTRRFVFPAEQFVRHESECNLGPSYSVWLPWDEIGGPQKNISLIARFEPDGGALVAGDQTRHLLPGTHQLASGETAPATRLVSDVQLAQYSQTSEISSQLVQSQKQATQRQQVTSIALSRKNWQQRLASSAAKSSNASEQERAAVLPGPAQ